jgi:hypothetical protein
MHKHTCRCKNYGNMENIYVATNNKSYEVAYKKSFELGFNSRQHLEALISAHVLWITRFLDTGWDGYFFTVQFHHLAGSRQKKIIQMHQEVETMYRRLATMMVRKPRSPKWAGLLPIGLFSPDLPVPKSNLSRKSTIADVSINDGLHMHGIVLGNRWGRILTGLHDHFEKKKGHYVTGKIRSIHITPIRYNPAEVVSYALKGLVKRTVELDDIGVLNWGGGGVRPTVFSELVRFYSTRDRNFWDSAKLNGIQFLQPV